MKKPKYGHLSESASQYQGKKIIFSMKNCIQSLTIKVVLRSLHL